MKGLARSTILAAALIALPVAAAQPAPAQAVDAVNKPFGDRLLRLAEILGVIHHLRDICGANEGQLWREKMLELLDVEDPPGQLRAQLIASFNSGYRGYRRTYSSCTGSAKTAENRFLTEGAELASELSVSLSAARDVADEAGEDDAGQ